LFIVVFIVFGPQEGLTFVNKLHALKKNPSGNSVLAKWWRQVLIIVQFVLGGAYVIGSI